MKRFLLFLVAAFITTTAIAHTINWYVDGSVYYTTTCESGENVTPPTAPEKYGYTFRGWKGYTQIEYLLSTGTQYIDTGIQGKDVYKIQIIIEITSGYIKADQKLFGFSYNSSGGIFFTTFQGYYRGTNIPVSKSKTEIQIITTDPVKRTTKAFVAYDNESFTATEWWLPVTGSVNTFPVFAAVSGNSGIIKSVYKCYQVKLYDSTDSLIRDMIPVLDGNGVPCMYDKVENKFYYNAGTGNFIAGPIVGE